MVRAKRCFFLVALWLVMSLSGFGRSWATPTLADTGTLFVSPSDTTVLVTDTFSLSIRMDSYLVGLKGFSIVILFNSAVLGIQSVTEGSLLSPHDVVLNSIVTADTLRTDGAVLNTVISGPGELLRIQFKALLSGVSAIHIVNDDSLPKLRDSLNDTIPAFTMDGLVTVIPVCSVTVDDDYQGGDLDLTHYNRIQEAIKFVCANCPGHKKVIVLSGTYYRGWGFDNGAGNYDYTDTAAISFPSDDIELIGYDDGGGIPVVTTVAPDPAPLLYENGTNSITLRYLKFTGASVKTGMDYAAVYFREADYLTFSDNIVTNNESRYGFRWDGIVSDSFTVLLQNNTIDSTDTKEVSAGDPLNEPKGWGIYFQNAFGRSTDSIVIRNNLCFDNRMDGICINGGRYISISSNQSYHNGYSLVDQKTDNWGSGISLFCDPLSADSVKHVAIFNNICNDNGFAGIWLGWKAESTALVQNEVYDNGPDTLIVFGGGYANVAGIGLEGDLLYPFSAGVSNLISQNSVYGNRGLGIDLGLDGHDPTCNVPGPNNHKCPPTLTGIAFLGGNQYQISGYSEPGDLVEIFYAEDSGDDAGYGEGKEFLQSVTASPGGSFVTVVTFSGPALFTATSTDANDNTSEFGNNATPPTQIAEGRKGFPSVNLDVLQNPASRSVGIRFSIGQKSRVKLLIYDVSGRLLKTLADRRFDPGTFTFRWVPETSGSYFVVLKTGKRALSKKVTFQR